MEKEKEVRKNRNKVLNERVIYAILRQEGYTHGQTTKIQRTESSSQGALDTLVKEKKDDVTRFEVIYDKEGVARTVVEVSNPEISKISQIVNIIYTSESTVSDLKKLLKTVDIEAVQKYLNERAEKNRQDWEKKKQRREEYKRREKLQEENPEAWKLELKEQFRRAFGKDAVR